MIEQRFGYDAPCITACSCWRLASAPSHAVGRSRRARFCVMTSVNECRACWGLLLLPVLLFSTVWRLLGTGQALRGRAPLLAAVSFSNGLIGVVRL